MVKSKEGEPVVCRTYPCHRYATCANPPLLSLFVKPILTPIRIIQFLMSTHKSTPAPSNTRTFPRTSLFVIALFSINLCFAQGQTIISNFDSDSYPGTSGNGWVTAWQTTANSGTSLTRNVKNTTPLNNGGNYLETTLTINADANKTIRGGGVSRQLDSQTLDLSSGVFNLSFDFRGTSPAGDTGPYRIFQSANSGKTGTSGEDTWALYAKTDGYWYVTNGNRAGAASESKLFSYTPGETYHFILSLDAAAKTYSITATSSAGATAKLENLGFRTAADGAGSWLYFLASAAADTNTSIAHTFAIDNIRIEATSIPEPAHLALVAGVILASAAFVIQRRRR